MLEAPAMSKGALTYFVVKDKAGIKNSRNNTVVHDSLLVDEGGRWGHHVKDD